MVKQTPILVPMGKVLWSKRVAVDGGPKHSAWYDHSYYKVPVEGIVDVSRIKAALVSRLSVQFLSNFGGQQHIGDVVDLGDGFIQVETLYSIGN